MASVFDQAVSILETVAPTVATAFGGPLAGQAVQFVEKSFGLTPSGSMDERTQAAAAAIVGATPDQMIALRKVETDFQAHIADLGIQLEQINAGDRDSARKREVALKDSTPSALALLVTAGFFGVLWWILTHGLPRDTAGSEALLTMLGALGAAFMAVLNYYFGSSASSRTKDETISTLSKG